MKVRKILCNFTFTPEGKACRECGESLWLDFPEKVSANNTTLSDTKDKTSGPLIQEKQQF